VGYSISFVGVAIAIVQGGLIKKANNLLGTKRSVYVGLVFQIVGFILFAFAGADWMMFAIMLPFAMGGIAGPSIQSIMTSQVEANEQGELQGAVTSLMSLSNIIGPLLMTSLFTFFTGSNAPVYFPGIPFLTGAVLTVVSFVIVLVALKKYGK
jgi:DHA1 family tetracycline resistance protein-like MFS transporter